MHGRIDTFPQTMEPAADDGQLVAQFQQGQPSVFNQLVQHYHPRIYQLVLRYVKDPEDARDVTQEAFLKTYQGLCDFKGNSQFYTWLYRIAVNLCIDFLRRDAKRKLMTDQTPWDELPMRDMADPHATPPSKAVENQELRSQIHEAILQLSPKQREVFMLRYYDGFSQKEIAQAVGSSLGTVKAHIFHAARNVQAHLLPYPSLEAVPTLTSAVRDGKN